jgi:hypothetical protein
MSTAQLWSVRHSFENSPAKTLETLARLGVCEIETYGTERLGPSSLRPLLEQYNIGVYAMHVPPPPQVRSTRNEMKGRHEDELDLYVEHMVADGLQLGTKQLVVMRDSENPFESTDLGYCESLNSSLTRFSRKGVRLMFHPYHTDLLEIQSSKSTFSNFTHRLERECPTLDFELDLFFIVLAAYEGMAIKNRQCNGASLLKEAIGIAHHLASSLGNRIKAIHVNAWKYDCASQPQLSQFNITDMNRPQIDALLHPFKSLNPRPRLIVEHDIQVDDPVAPLEPKERCFYFLEKSIRASNPRTYSQFSLVDVTFNSD